MKGRPIEYKYETSLEWSEAKKGILRSKAKPDIQVACPPEFGGHEGIWSPEDLFLSSIEVCFMTTFLWYINKENTSFLNYSSKSIGKVRLDRGKLRFYEIDLYININVKKDIIKEKIEQILKKVKYSCLISNSISSNVNINIYSNVKIN